MTKYLNMSTKELENANGYWTAREISQQPDCWKQVANSISDDLALFDWLKPILENNELRIILTGAGTSAYVGDTLAPFLTQKNTRLFESVSTTDLVSSPEQYLINNKPTLLVSYGRSGDSPESVAAVELADQVLEQCYHLIITCNSNGSLVKYANQSKSAYSVLMPEQTLDKSFAMTSSFTSMYVATLLIFDSFNQVNAASEIAEKIINNLSDDIYAFSKITNNKHIFLGSGGLSGIAKEAALKYLELTGGKIGCFTETNLGFRHGPKSNVDKKTIVTVMSSNLEYTRQYDLDLINEIKSDGIALEIQNLYEILPAQISELNDEWLGLTYIVYCQILAFFKSKALGMTPDNPCPTGEVNRVVKGVTLYPYVN